MRNFKYLKRLAIIVTLLFLGRVLISSSQLTQADYEIFLPVIVKTPYEPKKGLLIPYAYSSHCKKDLNALKVGWYYMNSTHFVSECPPDRRFVPRLSNANLVTTAVISTAIQNAQASGWLIGFVEPNISYWPSYTTPTNGAIVWRQIELQARPAGIKLVSPSPSQHKPGNLGGDTTYGYTWIWEMIDEYESMYGEKPHFDAMGWNYYDPNPTKFSTFLYARRQEALDRDYNVPFWILEYAGECWNTTNGFPTGNYEVMTQVTPILESIPWITRYAWFTNRIKADDSWAQNWHSCSLLDPDTNTLTKLGTLYAGY